MDELGGQYTLEDVRAAFPVPDGGEVMRALRELVNGGLIPAPADYSITSES